MVVFVVWILLIDFEIVRDYIEELGFDFEEFDVRGRMIFEAIIYLWEIDCIGGYFIILVMQCWWLVERYDIIFIKF